MLNMDGEGLEFEIPVVKGRQWHLAVNTAEPSPQDIADPGKERPIAGSRIRAEGRSVVVLLSPGKGILSDTILNAAVGVPFKEKAS